MVDRLANLRGKSGIGSGSGSLRGDGTVGAALRRRSGAALAAAGITALLAAAQPAMARQGGTAIAGRATAATEPIMTVEDVIRTLNNEPAQRISVAGRSWQRIADAMLDMTTPPNPPISIRGLAEARAGSTGTAFRAIQADRAARSTSVDDIHPGMSGWDKVAEWAKANQGLADALHAVRDTRGFALPYGTGNVDAKYAAKGFCVRIGVDGELRHNEYPYVPQLEALAIFIVAEMYRRLEAGEPEKAFEVAIDGVRFFRQLCDRPMLVEKAKFIDILSDLLASQRDAMFVYRDRVPQTLFREIAIEEYPFLAPGRSTLELPEGERIVGEALLRQVFDARGQPDVEKFGDVFGELQSADKPLTRFGAAKRWERVARVHGSLDASLKRLTDIYDDWYRRWRVPPYDAMQTLPTDLSRTNPIRYGAVIHSIIDSQALFEARKRLAAEVNGAAMAAGLCGYYRQFGSYPDDREKIYAIFARKASDADPWDRQYGRFLYFFAGSQRRAVDTPLGRIWVDGGVLYARGTDLDDDQVREVTEDGAVGDFLIWPPMRALERKEGLR
ncbi:MAG TPA: hypothetical protein PKC43_06830 [Phycisphaerales bacterium]|nr:hypothetical protein [Phycisphaerales bacterium]HMP37147.1 hypothetical protein [Phycisphaerales bacterium]